VAAPIRIRPRLQPYAWGDERFLPDLLGLEAHEGPCAEAWYGAHPQAPALAGEDGSTLDAFLAAHKELYFGPGLAARLDGLPYLLKLLAAARPLSIQTHPDPAQAAAGFAREEAAGIPRDAPTRSYRDPNHKPEILVALTEFHALCGFRRGDDLARALEAAPELSALVPGPPPATPSGLRSMLEAVFALPGERTVPALDALLRRLEAEDARTPFAVEAPEHWALEAGRQLYAGRPPDLGLMLVFLLEHVRLARGQALFLAPGVPHAYLRGAGVELMASSDNVLRAGLTSKHVDPAELLRIVRFDAGAPPVLEPDGEAAAVETDLTVPTAGLGLRRLRLGTGREVTREVYGPETWLALPGDAATEVRVTCDGYVLPLGRGQACLLPHGARVTVRATGPAEVFAAGVPRPMQDTWAREIREPGSVELVQRPPDGASPPDAAPTDPPGGRRYVTDVRRNIATAERLFAEGEPAHVIGTVCGSAAARTFWQRKLDQMRADFGARLALSLHEDLPVNQAFGLLLMWQRLRPHLEPGEGALLAFVFGEGTRASPFTEAECGQKPALSSFAQRRGRWLSIVELALRTFAPVEAFLRRSGFDGVVVKWGDEVQIPTRDLSGGDALFDGADVVRFVSVRAMDADGAANKDWVGVDEAGRVTAFIPRRPLAEMAPLAERGLLLRRGGRLYGGVNLGSIAVSRALLDLLLDEFGAEVNDPSADRTNRPDLDPQLFTALTVAALADPATRAEAWRRARSDSAAIEHLATQLPDVVDRLRGVLDRFEARHRRAPRFVALDFGDQYWGDIGQHRQAYAFYMALAARDDDGEISRALAGVGGLPDEHGNRLVGRTRLGPTVRIRNSVVVDAEIDSGTIEGCVLLGTRARRVDGRDAFDVESIAPELELEPGSGTYKVVSDAPVRAAAGERLTTVFFAGADEVLLRVREDTDLRDRERTYDRPILGNPLSFREAHGRVGADDPAAIEARREARRRELRSRLSRS